MKANVRLYGTLDRLFPGYDRSKGLDVEVPEDATVDTVLFVLGISHVRGMTAVVQGKAANGNERVQTGVPLYIFQSIQGG